VARHRSFAVPLAWLTVALIVYASLYPFTGWRVPGVPLFSFLALPWPHYWTWFDLVANLLGYVPLGALAFGAMVRSGWRAGAAAATACGLAAALSLAMELLQNFLPMRVSSNVDLFLNALGAALGVGIAALLHARGLVDRWQKARDRWFIARSAGGGALLVLWPIGLLFPAPVPLGLGQVLPRLQDLVVGWVAGTTLDTDLQDWLFSEWSPHADLSPGGEFMLMVLGFIAPCLVAFAISRRGWRRVLLVIGAALLGALATTLSTALNFGPEHAFAWATRVTPAALAGGLVLALLLCWVPRRAAAGLGLMALAALVVLVAQAPRDAYFADSLKAWEQGRFIRFHGAAQWVGWLWPFGAMAYLLARIAARGEDAGT
jgi:VanZ family protein